jgi:mannose-6-phosphate isomerase-like protein (cupin superfamily)
MKLLPTTKHRKQFEILLSTRSAQSAMMTLQPGGSSSDKPENEHPQSEQWLFVISGTGRARVSGRTTSLRPNSLLLIEKGEPHQITNTGRSPLVTLNFYSPPAYRKDGELLR